MTAQRFVLLLTLVNCLSTTFLVAQTTTLNGTWSLKNNAETTTVLTIADNYLMQTIYKPNRFISTRGGLYQVADNHLNLQLEFDTADSNRVGQTETYQITQRNGQLTLQRASEKLTFNQLEEKTDSAYRLVAYNRPC